MFRKTVFAVCRYLLAALFLFSGFVKGVDPAGTAIKISEYFYAFGWEAPDAFAKTLSVLLSAMELSLGGMLLLNLLKRTTSTLTLLVMGGFTLTTAYLAIANPVSDCGCFGDALVLTNTETFVKNIILTLLALSLFLYVRKEYLPKISVIENSYALIVILFSLSVGAYSTFRIAPMDFLPYAVGTDIREAMTIPENAPTDQYAITLTYRNKDTGATQTFSETDTEWQDSSKWEFVDYKSKLVKKGFSPRIHSFSIFDADKNDVSQQLLAQENCFLIIANKKEYLNDTRLREIGLKTLSQKGTPVVLTAEEIATVTARSAEIAENRTPVYNMDQKQLKSILRSDIGIVLIDKGVIKGKWMPGELTDNLETDIAAQQVKKENYLLTLLIVFGTIVVSYAVITAFKTKNKTLKGFHCLWKRK